MNTRSILLGGGLVFVAAVVFDMATPETADVPGPFVSGEITTITYDVSGSDLSALERQMKFKGPRGYWAYTRTSWNWDAQCNMTYKARVTLPRLASRSRLNTSDLAEWDRMIAALTAHEMGHVDIGRRWATAIKDAGCGRDDVKRIDREWRGKDSAYDRRTDHGRTEGVYLTRP